MVERIASFIIIWGLIGYLTYVRNWPNNKESRIYQARQDKLAPTRREMIFQLVIFVLITGLIVWSAILKNPWENIIISEVPLWISSVITVGELVYINHEYADSKATMKANGNTNGKTKKRK